MVQMPAFNEVMLLTLEEGIVARGKQEEGSPVQRSFARIRTEDPFDDSVETADVPPFEHHG
jgi:hypothetical protein